ncbi:hypothetical protein [Streptomyces sp. NPDC041003]|uniref:hypothetical protein n=1 Tax=Streptomyces sp. NPDC041003 TaxID=3155730 RepID=UPI0033D2DA47
MADDVIAALAKGGFGCGVALRNANMFGSDATFEVQHRGTTVCHHIPVRPGRGRGFVCGWAPGLPAHRRRCWDWFVWVWPGACVYVCDMAVALPAAVVLEPLAEKQEKRQEE